MKQFVFLMLLLVGVVVCRGQVVDWSKTRNWKIYALNNREAFFYSADTLVHFKSSAMNDSAVVSYLSHLEAWPKSKTASWMGLYIGSYEGGDGRIRKVVFSSYGGFLYDAWSKSYYELPKEIRQPWNDFIIENLQRVFE